MLIIFCEELNTFIDIYNQFSISNTIEAVPMIRFVPLLQLHHVLFSLHAKPLVIPPFWIKA